MDAVRLPVLSLPMAKIRTARLGAGGGSHAPVKPSGYIKDGLVFHLDGINKGANEGKWTDLIGGVEFTPDGNVQFGYDYICGVLNANGPVYYSVEDSTIEIVMRYRYNYNANCLWFNCGEETGICAGATSDALLIRQGNANPRYSYSGSFNNKGIKAISANKLQCLYNGKLNTEVKSVDFWINRKPFAMVSTAASKDIVEYCSIRIYNRLLTEEEMLHNQEVDYKRFDLANAIEADMSVT